jgi:peroxiredoxin
MNCKPHLLGDRFEAFKEVYVSVATTAKHEDLCLAFMEFVEEHGRLPRVSIDEEKQLARWVGRVRQNPHLLSDRFEEFNEAYEGVVTRTGRRYNLVV